MKRNILLIAFAISITNPAAALAAFLTPLKSIASSSISDTTNPSYVLKHAVADFRNLSRSERRLKIREAKKAIHEYKVAKKTNAEPSTNTLLLVILAILLPPLAVYLHQGKTNNKFWLSVILTLLFFIPGVIYALIVVLGE